MPNFKELAEVVVALKFVVAQGCPGLAADCKIVMTQNYSHLRERAWRQLSPDERKKLQQLMRSPPLAS